MYGPYRPVFHSLCPIINLSFLFLLFIPPPSSLSKFFYKLSIFLTVQRWPHFGKATQKVEIFYCLEVVDVQYVVVWLLTQDTKNKNLLMTFQFSSSLELSKKPSQRSAPKDARPRFEPEILCILQYALMLTAKLLHWATPHPSNKIWQ